MSAFDEKGHRIETVRRTGTLSEERVTVCYDDFDNPVEEVSSDESRVSRRLEPSQDMRPSNIERRTIMYDTRLKRPARQATISGSVHQRNCANVENPAPGG